MKSEKSTPRFLGAVFLFQAVASLVWTLLLSSLIVAGDISASMTSIANNVLQMRVSIVVTMLTAMGVAVLGILLFVVRKNQNKIIAGVAMGLYLIEATILAVSRIHAFALLSISQESVSAGHPTYLQTLGNLYYQAAEFGDWLHMLPFALGALLFYYLFLRSGYIPRILSLFGITAASLALIGTPFGLLGYEVPLYIFLPNLPFELTIGVWLLFRGIKDDSETGGHLSAT